MQQTYPQNIFLRHVFSCKFALHVSIFRLESESVHELDGLGLSADSVAALVDFMYSGDLRTDACAPQHLHQVRSHCHVT